MQVHGTALMEQPTDLPVVAGAPWFDTEDKPFVLRVEHPLSFADMVAALYMLEGRLLPVDLATREDVCGQIALVLTDKGISAIERTARRINRDERRGRVANPDWLKLCRERVAAVVAGGGCRA